MIGLLDAMDGFVYQYLIPAIIAGLGITLAQAGTIASANYFAAAIGGWTGGWLADRYGRARVLQVTILWFSIFSFHVKCWTATAPLIERKKMAIKRYAKV